MVVHAPLFKNNKTKQVVKKKRVCSWNNERLIFPNLN